MAQRRRPYPTEVQFKIHQPKPPESVCSLSCEKGQAKKYVEGESCCWHCFNCSLYQVNRKWQFIHFHHIALRVVRVFHDFFFAFLFCFSFCININIDIHSKRSQVRQAKRKSTHTHKRGNHSKPFPMNENKLHNCFASIWSVWCAWSVLFTLCRLTNTNPSIAICFMLCTRTLTHHASVSELSNGKYLWFILSSRFMLLFVDT